jgi:hypothetical protein
MQDKSSIKFYFGNIWKHEYEIIKVIIHDHISN